MTLEPSEYIPSPPLVTVPVNVTLPALTVLAWMAKLDVAIAAEVDAGRLAMATELAGVRNHMAVLFPGVAFEKTAVDRLRNPEGVNGS